MKVKEESEKVGLKLNIQKTKIMASDPTTSWQIDREIEGYSRPIQHYRLVPDWEMNTPRLYIVPAYLTYMQSTS